MIVLDTNVVSELMRPEPGRQVSACVQRFPSDRLYITAVTEAEIRLGTALLPLGKRRRALEQRVDMVLMQEFAGRKLPFDSNAAEEYGSIVAHRRAAGRPIHILDAQIAAIARAHSATLLTRNVRDFDGCAVELLNPWA